MENELGKLSSKELLELYLANKEFVVFLDKEYENTAKMEEDK